MVYFLWLSRRICALFSAEGTGWQMDISDTSSTLSSSESNEYHDHSMWNPMLELLRHVTHISAYSWKHSVDEGRCGESCTFLSLALHWTCYATKDEVASEGKAPPLLSLQTYRARPEMTKRERERSITLNDYDPQSLEVARQLETESILLGLTIRYMTITCVTFFWTILSLIFMAQASRVPPIVPHMRWIGDGCRVLPRSVLQADTIIVICGQQFFERTSWSTQRTRKFG